MEDQAEDAERRGVAYLAVRPGRSERAEATTARTDDELAQPEDGIDRTVRGLGREALVVVVVANEDDVGAVLVQGTPEGTDELEIGFSGVRPRREERMVPVRE